MLNKLFKIFVAFAICYFIILVSTYFQQRSLLYFPDPVMGNVNDYNLVNTQEEFVELNGKKIQLWYHKPENPKMLVIYLHGNAHHLGFRSEQFREIIAAGYGFIAPSYPGFGKSEGSPTKDDIIATARSAVKFAQDKGYDTKDIVLVGESLGSGVASEIATEFPFKGLMLITPYTTIAERAEEIYWYLPASYILKDNFNNIDNIKKINIPLLIVHGTSDTVIPMSHSQKLIEAANDPKKLIIYEGKGHNNLDFKKVYTEMREYFNNGQ
jgi:uncharacterized protein